jgi:G3E family GTPase
MEEDHADDKLMIGESVRQIAGCDVIILNKMDLADSKVLAETEQMIQNINPAAPVYKTIKGEIDLKHILGISAYKLPSSILINENPRIHSENCNHDHEPTPNHYEIRGISSLQVSCPAMDQSRLDKLDEWIRCVLWENRIPGSTTTDSEVRVLRCKGAFTSTTGIHYVLQGVQSMYEISELDAAAADSLGVPEVGKIVLIGKGLDDNIRRSLDSVLA